jgi:hypothetical protein
MQRSNSNKPAVNFKLSQKHSLVSESDSMLLKEVLQYQNRSLTLAVNFMRSEDLIAVEKGTALELVQTVELPYDTQFDEMKNRASKLITSDKRAKRHKGNFRLDLKFFKYSDCVWVPMNTELQWIHAKSCALDHPSHELKILFAAINDSDIIKPNSVKHSVADSTESIISDFKTKIDISFYPPTNDLDAPHSFASVAELSGPMDAKQSAEHYNTLFNDSIFSLQTSSYNPEKQNAMARNLEKRITKARR